jgi:Skp family chaperone for outer membrane proteins
MKSRVVFNVSLLMVLPVVVLGCLVSSKDLNSGASQSSGDVSLLEKRNEKKPGKMVSINSALLMQKSKKGQVLAKEVQGKIDEFQGFVTKSQKEFADLQGEIKEKSKDWGSDVIQKKNDELTQKKKDFERMAGDKEEALRGEIQKKHVSLRDELMKVVQEFFEKKEKSGEWDFMIDSQTPGLLFSAKATDVTGEALIAVNASFEKISARAEISGKATSGEAMADAKKIGAKVVEEKRELLKA